MASSVLSQLHILCTNAVKQHCSKNNDSPVIHRSCSTACSPSNLISSYTETFSTVSGIRRVFWISPQLDILCTSAVKRCCAKFVVHVSPVFARIGVYRSKKTCHRVVLISVWSTSYSESFATEIIIVIWLFEAHCCYTVVSDTPERNKTGARPTAQNSSDCVYVTQ